MKYLKWLAKWKDAEVNHEAADWLSSHKGFQKFILSLYNTPAAMKNKWKELEEKIGDSYADHDQKEKQESVKLLQGKKGSDKDQ